MDFLTLILVILRWIMYAKLVIKVLHYVPDILVIFKQQHLCFRCNILIIFKNCCNVYAIYAQIQRWIWNHKKLCPFQRRLLKNTTILAVLLKSVNKLELALHVISLNLKKLSWMKFIHLNFVLKKKVYLPKLFIQKMFKFYLKTLVMIL